METVKHKRFLVFAWGEHYPSGGLHDLVASFDDQDGAIGYIDILEDKESYNWVQIYDRINGVFIPDYSIQRVWRKIKHDDFATD